MKKEIKILIGAFIALAIELIVGGIYIMFSDISGIVILVVGIVFGFTASALVKSERCIQQYNQALQAHDYQQASVIASKHPAKIFQYIMQLDALLCQGDSYHYLELYAAADMQALCHPRQKLTLYRYYRTKIIYDFLSGSSVMFDQVDSVLGLPANHDTSLYVEAIRSIVAGNYLQALQYTHKLEGVLAKSGNSTQLDKFLMAYINCLCYSALGKIDEQMLSHLSSLDYNDITHRICAQEQLILPAVSAPISPWGNQGVYGDTAKKVKKSRVPEIILWIFTVSIALGMIGGIVMLSLGIYAPQSPIYEYQAVVSDVGFWGDNTCLQVEGHTGYLVVYEYCIVEGQTADDIAVGDTITYTVEEGFFAVEYDSSDSWYYSVTSLTVDQEDIVTLDSYNAIMAMDNAEIMQTMLSGCWVLCVLSTVLVLVRSQRRLQG